MPSESKLSSPTPSESKETESRNVLKKAITYCWSEDFLGRFRDFFSGHAQVFEGHARENMAASKTEDVASPTTEHSLAHDACFRDYLSLFEETLEEYVKGQNSTNGEFYQQLSELKDSPTVTADEKLFIDCLLASADYDSFYSVMIKEAKKLIIMREHNERYGNPSVHPPTLDDGGDYAGGGGEKDLDFGVDDMAESKGGDAGDDDCYDDEKGAK